MEETVMGIIGFILSLVAAFFMLISLIPFIGGWISFFITLPLSIIAAAFSGYGISRRMGGIALVGLIISAVIIVLAIARIAVGCGII
jgi:hypothetical protein